MRVVNVPRRNDRAISILSVVCSVSAITCAILLAVHEKANFHYSWSAAGAVIIMATVMLVMAIVMLVQVGGSWRIHRRAHQQLLKQMGTSEALSDVCPSLLWNSLRTIAKKVHAIPGLASEAVLVCIGVLPKPATVREPAPLLMPLEFINYRPYGLVVFLAAALWGAWYFLPWLRSPTPEVLVFRQGLLLLALAVSLGVGGYVMWSSRTVVRIMPGCIEVRRYPLLFGSSEAEVVTYNMAPGTVVVVSGGSVDFPWWAINDEVPRAVVYDGNRSDTVYLRRGVGVTEVIERLSVPAAA
jgi:hypothetical protein